MPWFFFAFIPAIGDALGNIFDGHFSNKHFKNPWILLFYSGITELLFLPVVLLYRLPVIFSPKIIALFAVVALLDFFTLIFYYQALKEDDTSIVASLFSLGKVFVPVLAYFMVGERLTFVQYIAFVVIIFSSTLLTVSNQGGKIKFNKSLLLMCASSLIHSVEGVIYKYALEQVDWVSGFFYVIIFSTLGFIIIAAFKYKDIKSHLMSYKNHFRLILFNSGVSFGSNLASALAFSMAPITLVKGIFATQPFFVILLTYLLRPRFKAEYRERMDAGNMIKKLVLFSVILVALLFVVY
ncbi:MAG: EamA family transporter [Candidatus Magasanikbacteria bacterium]